MTTKPHRKENLYFSLRILFSLVGLCFVSLGISKLFPLAESSFVVTIGIASI